MTRPRTVAAVAALAIVLTALNLRPAVPSVGALLREIQLATGMSSSTAGVLASLPPICFGIFGLVGGWFGRRVGTVVALVVALGLTSAGLAARVATARPGLIVAFTIPAMAGMALGNVLLPVAVKRWFPRHIGRMTGLYSFSLAIGTAIAAAVSVPIAQTAGSWRAGLGVWALTPLLAIPAWLLLRRLDAPPPRDDTTATTGTQQVPGGRAMHRSPRAWAFAGFFGLQSLGAYAIFGWLPTVYRDAGISAGTAGALLALVIILGAPISVILPELAAKRDDQRPFVVGLTAAAGLAYVGLLVAPAGAPWAWATLLGIGMGTFPLALLLIGLRARNATATAQLSGLTQGAGYLIAAGGPFAIGALHDATGAWTWPLAVLLVLLVPQLLCGLVVARPGYVE